MNSARVCLFACCLSAAPLLGGCLGGHAPVLPETQQRAETALARGIRAEKKGDPLQAEQYLLESLALSTSIEDNPARITALINLSRLQRLNNNPVQAASFIDRALRIHTAAPGLNAEAAYEKALVELAGGSAAGALPWAEKAIEADRKHRIAGRYNLAARIQLLLGNWREADALAAKGLNECRSAGDAEEEANALRISGMAAREQQQYDLSLRLLQEALQIDKSIGISSKISADLEELALTAEKAGRKSEAAGYLQRAVEIHRAAGREERIRALAERSSKSTGAGKTGGQAADPPRQH